MMVATEVFDGLSLTQSSLRVTEHGVLEKIPQMGSKNHPHLSSSSQHETDSADYYVDVLIEIKITYAELKASLAELQKEM